MKRVTIEGASGYAGIELTRILARHPAVELVAVTSSRWAGRTVRQELGLSGATGALTYQPTTELPADAVCLATPAEASRTLAPRWLDRGARVVDLSNAYRGHDDAVYGLTEHARQALGDARLVANPGCYPTATLLALLPPLRDGLLADGPLIVDAKSGATGAGRKLTDSLLYNELAHNHYPYRVGHHQHVPEMERVLGRSVVFTPHLLPTRRGLLSTIYAPVSGDMTVERLYESLRAAYEGEPFVQLVAPDAELGVGNVVGTPLARVAVGPTIKDGIARLFGCIDNLLKGAASQAVQNLNRILGLDESSGLLP